MSILPAAVLAEQKGFGYESYDSSIFVARKGIPTLSKNGLMQRNDYFVAIGLLSAFFGLPGDSFHA